MLKLPSADDLNCPACGVRLGQRELVLYDRSHPEPPATVSLCCECGHLFYASTLAARNMTPDELQQLREMPIAPRIRELQAKAAAKHWG